MKIKWIGFLCLVFSTQLWAGDVLRVSPKGLSLNLDQVVILDARTPADFKQGHIKGALNFPVDWTYNHKKENGQIISPARIQIILRQLGLEKNMPVVVYDDGQLVDAARLFWTLEVYGFNHVKVLDHGYDAWVYAGYPVSNKVGLVKESHYIPSINHERLATKFTTQIATKVNSDVIIDARSASAYRGEHSSAKRFGHIPTAQNIPASHNLMVKGNFESLLPVDELKKVYQHIPKDKKVIIYCAIGRISATNYLALRELGYDVANYDASWKEWGNDETLPIEK